MKRFHFFVVALLLAANVNAQEAVTAAGGSARVGNISVSWSIGEAMTETYVQTSFTLTQGVQQPVVKVENVSSSSEMNAYKIVAYPNPTSDAVTVSVAGTTGQSLALKLFDATGKLLQATQMTDSETRVSLSNLPAGIYLLQVSDSKNNVQIFKIIKN